MSGWARVGAFVAGCAVLFAVALGVGQLAGPVSPAQGTAEGHQAMAEGMGHEDHAGGDMDATAHDVGGLEVSSAGYALVPAQPQLPAGRQRLAFTITDPGGHPVTDYDEQHERDLHLIVVRRDLTGFQHVHPVLDRASGEWSIDVDLTPGAWRVLADFLPTGGEPLVLGSDLLVPGDFAPQPLGPDSSTAEVDGYDVTLGRELSGPGEDTVLTATVSRDGRPVTDLQPYLGAYGHLVSLRNGDVGYLHVHPDEAGGPGPAITFHTAFPSTGRYRLFLDFRHDGQVHTAQFTVTVAGGHDH